MKTIAALVAATLTAPAMAQEGAVDELAPVIVEGELRTRDLQETLTSVAVISGEALEASGDFDLFNVIERTPGITAIFGDQGFAIRGVSQLGVGGSGNGLLVSTNVDGATVSNSPFLTKFGPYSMWDLEQIEVLRGPQSTQQGRNALAGAVILRSRDPVHAYEARLRGDVGSLGTTGVAGALNVPIIQDVMALRVAADFAATDGYIDNVTLGTDSFDARERHTIRGALLFEPTPDISAVLKLTHARNFGGEDLVDAATFPDRRVSFDDVPGQEGAETDIANLRLGYDLSDHLTVQSETTYLSADYTRTEDFDGTANPLGTLFRFVDVESLEQEIKLVYDTPRLKGVAGIFYAGVDEDAPAGALVPATALSPFLPPTSVITVDITTAQETANFATFGELEWRVLPRLGLIVGGRYDRETIRFLSVNGFSTDDPNIEPFLPPSTVTESKTSFDALLPKAGVVYDWTDDLSTGFTVQRGYRAGGTSVNGLTGVVQEFDPEHTWNLELALRSQWFDRRLTANANVFYTDWSDQQVDVAGPTGNPLDSNVFNAGSSQLYGGELELRARPLAGLEVFAGAAYVQTEFQEFAAGGVDFSNNAFPFAPEWTFAIGGDYALPGGVFVGADASFTDDAFVDAANTAELQSEARFLVNARAGWRGDGVEVFAFVRNLLDEDYVTQGVGDGTPGTVARVRVGEPLTFGVVAQVEF